MSKPLFSDKTEFQKLCERLEAERNDISYRQPAQAQIVYVDRVIRKTNKLTTTEREKENAIYYNAGRYQEGARDKTALKAHQKLQQILSQSDE